MNISLIGNSALRIAVQRNLVSFPSQVPAFLKRPGDDTQQRIAHLYFERGWPMRNICARYGLGKAMAQRLVSEWRIRAVAAGYIQEVHPEDLNALVNVRDEAGWPLPAVARNRRPDPFAICPDDGYHRACDRNLYRTLDHPAMAPDTGSLRADGAGMLES